MSVKPLVCYVLVHKNLCEHVLVHVCLFQVVICTGDDVYDASLLYYVVSLCEFYGLAQEEKKKTFRDKNTWEKVSSALSLSQDRMEANVVICSN